MKQTPEMDRIQAEMRPGHISLDGFLGDDGRKLIDILTEDEAAVARLGLTQERIAARMAELRDAGAKGLDTPVEVEGRFRVSVESERGRLACPFGDPGVHPKTLITVRNLTSGLEIIYTDLSIHMVAAHGFYQGRGARFRLDPAELARVLELPDVE